MTPATAAPAASSRPLTPAMRTLLIGALWCLSVIVFAATASAFAESYQGLKSWALDHRVPEGWRANAWPLQVDAYILAGEIVLLVAAIRAWGLRARLLGWTLTGSGLVASIIWNAGHVGASATDADHITAAVPPVAAVAGLMASLAVIKRLAEDPVMTPALTMEPASLAARTGEITVRPVTPAARTAILTALTADLSAAVGDTGRTVAEIDRMTPSLTSGRRDAQTSTADTTGQIRPAPLPGRVSFEKGRDPVTPIPLRRPDVQTSTDGPDDDPEPEPSGPGTGRRDRLTTQDAQQRVTLAELPSNAARVRYVLDSFGLDTTPMEAAKFLASYGFDIELEAVRSAIRRARQAARDEQAGKPLAVAR